MFYEILNFIKRLFGITPRVSLNNLAENSTFVREYERIDEINFTYIVANRLANAIASDSSITVDGENPRSEYLGDSLKGAEDKLKLIAARTLGTGGVVLKPYSYDGKLFTSILSQDRMFELERIGDVPTKVVFLADVTTPDANLRKEYRRLEYHSLENGVYTIEQRALDGSSVIPLTSIVEWAHIPPIMRFTNVDKMLFGFVKCPIDNKRQTNDLYGVPVTYGNDKLIKEILFLMDELQNELKSKKTFVGADRLLFKNGELPDSGLYKLFRSGAGGDSAPFWEIFSPEIRNSSYIDTIDYKLGLLEKAIGVNKGILTDLDTVDATATAIRRSTFDTFSLVDATRRNIEIAIDQLVYAFDVFADAFSLAPSGEYTLKYDWSYAMISDDSQTFMEYMQAAQAGILSDAEVRAWMLDIDLEEAERTLPEIEIPNEYNDKVL